MPVMVKHFGGGKVGANEKSKATMSKAIFSTRWSRLCTSRRLHSLPSVSWVSTHRRLYSDVRQNPPTGAQDRATVGVSKRPWSKCSIVTHFVSQVFTPKAAVLFVATGVGLYYYFQHEKQKLLEEKRNSSTTLRQLV